MSSGPRGRDVCFDEYRFSTTARHITNISSPVESYDEVPGVTVTVDPLGLSASLRGNFEDPVEVIADPFSASTSLDGEPFMPVTVIADPFTLTPAAAGACVVAMPPAAFTHSQSIDPPKVTVTRDIPPARWCSATRPTAWSCSDPQPSTSGTRSTH